MRSTFSRMMFCPASDRRSALAFWILTTLFAACNSSVIGQDQGLKDLAEPWGIDFGFLVSPENVGNSEYENAVIREASVATVTAYWKIQTHNEGRDQYDWTSPDTTVAFALEHDIALHGHPLVWAHDDFIPDWVLASPEEEAEAEGILREHIEAVAGRYQGAISLWHVVNEAFTWTGEPRDSYWYRTLGENLLGFAFTVARETDPDATLIYNDYGMLEIDDRKYEAVKAKLLELKTDNVPVDGIGWQMHVTPQQVLSEDFPMELRMQEMSLLGFTNYITELDIAIPSNSEANLLLQRTAYQKITEIFLRIENRGAMQTWDVSDGQSWLGVDAAPLLFDVNYQSKPGYTGVQAALSEKPLLDLDVTATLSRAGVLTVRGSVADNNINIIKQGASLYVAGYTQEFPRAAVEFSGVPLGDSFAFDVADVKRIRVYAFAGDDTVSMFPVDATSQSEVVEEGGDGAGENDPPATLESVIVEVFGAAGDDEVSIEDLSLGKTTVLSAAGTSEVVVNRTVVDGDLRITGGAAVDTVALADVVVQGRTFVTFAGGDDDLQITDSLFADIATFNTGGGDDTVTLSSADGGGNLFGGRAYILLAGGDDLLTVADTSFTDVTRLFGYGGADSLQMSNLTSELELDIRTIEDVVGDE